MAKPLVKFTDVQRNKQWSHRVQLENHHEAALPSQRYHFQRQLPPPLNPIVPQDVSNWESMDSQHQMTDFPPSFLELNAPRQRPPMLGNPIFGYSTHPMAPPVAAAEGSSVAKSATSERLAELQVLLQEERRMRKVAEAKLAQNR